MTPSHSSASDRGIRALRTTMSSSSSSGSIAVETRSSTCTWTQLDVDAQCVLRPRSCYDCLNVLPTSSELCTLTPDGICSGADAYDPSRDYRRSYPPHLNFFPAANATYCERDEPVCALCRARTFGNWESNPSQFCLGQSGCVCVSICESDSWQAAVRPALQNALETSNGLFANCTLEQVARDENSAAANSSDDDATHFVGLSETKDIYSGSNECMWVQNQTYCGAPRSCFDCLNAAIYSGNKCMLHSSGYCTSMAFYDRFQDYRRSNGSAVLFPSTNATYCPPEDPICSQCRTNQTFTQWTGVSSPAQFCIGAGGCVCVASCESPLWQSAVVGLTCNTSAVPQTTALPTKQFHLSAPVFWVITSLSVVFSCVFVLLLLSCFRRFQQYRDQRRRHPPRLPKGPVLELNGWKAMREQLIETEREFIGETGTMAHLEAHRRLNATSSDSANVGADVDDADDLDTPVVPAVIIEEGDTYRPISPSRMHAHR